MSQAPVPALVSVWRRYRWLRAAAWALLALGLWWLLGWLALPSLLHRPLERLASAQLGRQVTVGAIAFKPWSLELTLRDLSVAGTPDAAGAGGKQGAPVTPPQLHIASIYVDAELQSLFRLGPVLDALRIDAPTLRITHQGQGRYDVDDLIAKLTAPSEKPPSKSGPLRMALHNLELTNGSIDFADLPAGTTHRVRGLHLGLPFLSTLPAQRTTYVAPQLSFTVNGSPFDLKAQAQPFTPERAGKAALRWKGVDLAPYLPYLPASLPVRLQGAVLDVDLQLNFAQAPRPSVQFSGQVRARQLRLADRQAQPLLALEQLRVDLADVRPLERVVKLALVELTAPQVYAARRANGALNWAQLGVQTAQAAPDSANKASPPKVLGAGAPNEPGKGAAAAGAGAGSTAKAAAQGASAPARAPASTPAGTAPVPADAGWNVEVVRVAVQGGRVQWRDESTRPGAALEAHHVTLEARGFALPWRKPMPLHGALELPAQGTLAFEGEVGANQAKLQVKAKNVALQLAAPYLAQVLEPTLAGQLDGTLGLQWQAPGAGSGTSAVAADAAHAAGLRVSAQPLVLQKLALRQGKDTLASVGRIELQGAEADLAQRQITLQRLAIAEPQLAVAREPQGRWMFERWLRGGAQAAGADAQPPAQAADQAAEPAAEKSTAKAKAAQTAPATTPWRVQLGELALSGGAIDYRDEAQGAAVRPVALRLSALQIQARALSTEGRKPIALQLSAQVAARRGKPGELRYQGSVTPTPLALQGRITALKLPLHALDGYLAEFLALRLRHADLGFLGQLAYAQTPQGPKLLLAGDVALDAVRADSTAASTAKTASQVGQELLSWQDLSLRGLRLALAPQQPLRLDVVETSLSDFYGRIALNEEGRLNLADIVKSTGKGTGKDADKEADADGAGVPGSASASPSAVAPAQAAAQTVAQATPQAPAPTTQPTPARDPLAPVIHFGPMSLVNGTVQFSDFFIRPNYSADLSQLTGKLSAFSSEAPNGVPELAELELRGRVEGSATLEVTGKLNPLVHPLVLDIQGKAHDLDLPPLSPYAIKYAGHGIESGKLNMDVAYKVQPDGQLTASNKLVLRQLTFGEPVEGAPASLPVRLATALLADSNGVIDLDLPISGSLNDPQFRLGPVILKILGNIITRAVTAPFRLLAHAFGGGTEDLGQVVFAPGSPELTAEARQQLDKVVQVLSEKPALQVSVTGMVNLAQEREGLQRERLRQLVLAEKRRAGRGSAAKEPATPPASDAAKAPAAAAQDLAADEEPTLSADEYASLLKRVYRRADIPKPRNLLGLTKDLPVPEMEALLLAHLPASEDLAREVATHRAQAVVRYLSAHQLPLERLFVNAPKVSTTPEEGWVPRAKLGLAMH